jgi:hypothetical protein
VAIGSLGAEYAVINPNRHEIAAETPNSGLTSGISVFKTAAAVKRPIVSPQVAIAATKDSDPVSSKIGKSWPRIMLATPANTRSSERSSGQGEWAAELRTRRPSTVQNAAMMTGSVAGAIGAITAVTITKILAARALNPMSDQFR